MTRALQFFFCAIAIVLGTLAWKHACAAADTNDLLLGLGAAVELIGALSAAGLMHRACELEFKEQPA